MKQFSRDTLIEALAKENPDRPKVFYEMLSDQDLHTEFQSCANGMADRIREHRVLQVDR